MEWVFLLVSTISWGIAEIFYKRGNLEREKYSHLKTTVFVGFMFAAYALVIATIQSVKDIEFLKNLPINMLIYLPVALCYIISMTCSYFGVRFIQESISDPIENSSGAIVPILCAIFMHEAIPVVGIVGICIVVVGLVCISFFDKSGKEDRHKKFGKKLAVLAFAMPFCYALLDAAGTFLDVYYTDDASSTLLRGVTDDTLEHMANCCYEFTFFLVAIGILIFLKIKKVKLFGGTEAAISNEENEELLVSTSNKKVIAKKVVKQKDKLFAALFETIGQATYLFALSEGGGIAAVILGAGTVISSLILSRIVLKEKLSILQYIFIAIVLAGIIVLSFVD